MKLPKVDFRLLLVTDRKSAGNGLISVLKQSLKSGVKAVQLREKDLAGGKLAELAKEISSLAIKYNSELIVNERLDIALLSGADGIHFPEKSPDVKYYRKYKNLLFGKSAHSLQQAKLAEKDGYDYIIFGPVFRTPAKVKYGSPKGLKELEKVCAAVKIPVFAVGGITSVRVKKCLKAGAHGIAVIRAVMNSNDVKKAVIEFKKELGEL